MKETKTMKKKQSAPLNNRFITSAFWNGALAATLACVIIGVLACAIGYIQQQNQTLYFYGDVLESTLRDNKDIREAYEASLVDAIEREHKAATKPAVKRLKRLEIASNSCGR
jgi:hypothetical protein